MILGILSDTHGKARIAKTAVDLLLSHGAQYLIHCGDVGSTAVLDQLAGHPSLFVFGNTDWDRQGLSSYASDIDVVCGNDEAKLSFNNKRIVVTHGDNDRIVRRVLADNAIDYLFLGHTHEMRDQRHGTIRIINPGALYRASEKTVALLDTETDVLSFLPVVEAEG